MIIPRNLLSVMSKKYPMTPPARRPATQLSDARRVKADIINTVPIPIKVMRFIPSMNIPPLISRAPNRKITVIVFQSLPYIILYASILEKPRHTGSD
jgi:hypothetical protein